MTDLEKHREAVNEAIMSTGHRLITEAHALRVCSLLGDEYVSHLCSVTRMILEEVENLRCLLVNRVEFEKNLAHAERAKKTQP